MADVSADKTVYVVHCTDTEGPLYESSAATIERIQEIINYQISELPSTELIKRLKEGSVDLQGREEKVKKGPNVNIRA